MLPGSRDIDSDAHRLGGPNNNNINARLDIMSESVEDKISDIQDEIDDLKIARGPDIDQMRTRYRQISNLMSVCFLQFFFVFCFWVFCFLFCIVY